jgi:hypothetical protein
VRRRKMSCTVLVLAAAGTLVLNVAMSQAADISVGSVEIRPNEQRSVTVALNVESGETAVATLTDIEFQAGAAVPPRFGVIAILSADIDADDTAIPIVLTVRCRVPRMVAS